jgi:hypothetical protein
MVVPAQPGLAQSCQPHLKGVDTAATAASSNRGAGGTETEAERLAGELRRVQRTAEELRAANATLEGLSEQVQHESRSMLGARVRELQQASNRESEAYAIIDVYAMDVECGGRARLQAGQPPADAHQRAVVGVLSRCPSWAAAIRIQRAQRAHRRRREAAEAAARIAATPPAARRPPSAEDAAAIRNLCARADLGFPTEVTVRECLATVRKVKGDMPEVVRMIRRRKAAADAATVPPAAVAAAATAAVVAPTYELEEPENMLVAFLKQRERSLGLGAELAVDVGAQAAPAPASDATQLEHARGTIRKLRQQLRGLGAAEATSRRLAAELAEAKRLLAAGGVACGGGAAGEGGTQDLPDPWPSSPPSSPPSPGGGRGADVHPHVVATGSAAAAATTIQAQYTRHKHQQDVRALLAATRDDATRREREHADELRELESRHRAQTDMLRRELAALSQGTDDVALVERELTAERQRREMAERALEETQASTVIQAQFQRWRHQEAMREVCTAQRQQLAQAEEQVQSIRDTTDMRVGQAINEALASFRQESEALTRRRDEVVDRLNAENEQLAQVITQREHAIRKLETAHTKQQQPEEGIPPTPSSRSSSPSSSPAVAAQPEPTQQQLLHESAAAIQLRFYRQQVKRDMRAMLAAHRNQLSTAEAQLLAQREQSAAAVVQARYHRTAAQRDMRAVMAAHRSQLAAAEQQHYFSLGTSALVQQTAAVSQADVDRAKAKVVFRRYDADADGHLSYHETATMLSETAATGEPAASTQLSRHEFDALCHELGCDAALGLDLSALITWRLREAEDRIARDFAVVAAHWIFETYDTQGVGCLDIAAARRLQAHTAPSEPEVTEAQFQQLCEVLGCQSYAGIDMDTFVTAYCPPLAAQMGWDIEQDYARVAGRLISELYDVDAMGIAFPIGTTRGNGAADCGAVAAGAASVSAQCPAALDGSTGTVAVPAIAAAPQFMQDSIHVANELIASATTIRSTVAATTRSGGGGVNGDGASGVAVSDRPSNEPLLLSELAAWMKLCATAAAAALDTSSHDSLVHELSEWIDLAQMCAGGSSSSARSSTQSGADAPDAPDAHLTDGLSGSETEADDVDSGPKTTLAPEAVADAEAAMEMATTVAMRCRFRVDQLRAKIAQHEQVARQHYEARVAAEKQLELMRDDVARAAAAAPATGAAPGVAELRGKVAQHEQVARQHYKARVAAEKQLELMRDDVARAAAAAPATGAAPEVAELRGKVAQHEQVARQHYKARVAAEKQLELVRDDVARAAATSSAVQAGYQAARASLEAAARQSADEQAAWAKGQVEEAARRANAAIDEARGAVVEQQQQQMEVSSLQLDLESEPEPERSRATVQAAAAPPTVQAAAATAAGARAAGVDALAHALARGAFSPPSAAGCVSAVRQQQAEDETECDRLGAPAGPKHRRQSAEDVLRMQQQEEARMLDSGDGDGSGGGEVMREEGAGGSVAVTFDAPGSLGLSLVPGDGLAGAVLKAVKPGSPVELHAQLLTGMALHAMQIGRAGPPMALAGRPYRDILAELKQAGRPLILSFSLPLPSADPGGGSPGASGGGGGGGGSPRSTAARRHSCTFCEPGPLGITWQRYQLPGRQRGQEMMLVPIVTGVKAGGASQRAGVQKLQLLHSINGMPVLQQEWCVYPPVGPEKSKSTKESRDCHTARARALCSTSHCLRG